MEIASNLKAVYIIVNAGFADDVVEMARQAGAGGATIINARGAGPVHQEILGISIDEEKEMILTLVEEDVSEKILSTVKEKAGAKSPANGVCFVMPVAKSTTVNTVNKLPPLEK